ncbi:hypothetical protein G9A89_019745 [Geosiphon pyriformis]|nr:hypothetical protein G9A89_019745 [Geosiphon pyriformis]
MWTSEERSEWNQTQETPPTTIVTIVTMKNTVTQKDTKNRMRNCASLVENRYQKDVTGTTYQTEEECVTQLANTQSLSVTGTTTNNYAPLDKSKNNTSPKSTLTSAKTVLSHAKISVVKSVKTKGA